MNAQSCGFVRYFMLMGCVLPMYFLSCARNNPVTPPPVITPAEPDSSSHDFVWEEISIGYDHSYLKDVFAINDTDVWAVGEINTMDYVKHQLIRHSAIHWDGRTWSIVDIPIPLEGTIPYVTSRPNCVYAFSHDDVWFGTGVMTHWDGKKYTYYSETYDAFPSGETKMWGRRPNDFYLVGKLGALAHFDGHQFQILNSGITYDFNDVWGQGDTALAVASTWLFDNSPSYIYRLVNGKVEQAYMSGLQRGMTSIWFRPGMRRLTCTGRWHLEWNGTAWVQAKAQPPLRFVEVGIRGNSPVDFFVVDQARGVAHWNGKSWSLHKVGEDGDCLFSAITCTKNHVWAVGCDARDRTLILHGRRAE